MRTLRLTCIFTFLLIVVSLAIYGCSNPDSIPPAGFSLSPSPVKVVFTDPQFRVEGSHGVTGSSDPYTLRTMESVGLTLREKSDLMSYIDSAMVSIDLCTTRIQNQGMVLKLVALANRGVTIRIVTEKGYFNDPNSIPLIQQLIEAGVLIRTDNDDLNRQMHQRYWIIDKHIVLSGSGDLLDASFERSANHTLIFDSPLGINAGSDVSAIQTITDAFFFDFTQMFDRGLFGKNKETMLKHTFKIGVDVEIYFGPNDDLRTQVRDQIVDTDQYLFYAVTQASDNTIAGQLNALIQAGFASVTGIIDGPSSTFVYPNASLYNFPNMNGMGHKFMVIDVPLSFDEFRFFTIASSNDPVVVSSSANWTSNGLEFNDETFIAVHDLTLAFEFAVGEANALDAAVNNTGIVYGEVRSAHNNIGLEVPIEIESRAASSYFPGTPPDDPIQVDSDPDNDGFYGAFVPTGELFRLEVTEAPEAHLIPEPKFLFGDTHLLLPGASYEANFFPVLAPTGTGTGGT